MNATLNRRQFVFRGSVLAAAAALARGPFAGLAFGDDAAEGKVLPFLDIQPMQPGKPAINWQDLTDWMTPATDFFSVSHYGAAKVSADGYKLAVTGLVSKPLSLSLDELKSRPRKEVTATLECSGNGASPGFMGAIGNAKWAGTPLVGVLKEAGVAPEAVEVAFWGADTGKEKIRGAEYEQNFARSLSIAHAMRDDVLLAYEMNGKPLAPGHGFPLRLIVPGWYGIAWVKWLTTLEVRDRRLMNRFMARDYVTVRGIQNGNAIQWKETSVGPMNIKSLVARVIQKKDGSATVQGAAWTDGTPLKSVELKIDDGPWLPATLDTQHRARYSWTFWTFDWKNPRPGEHTLVSRATDEKGRIQPAADDPAIKLKKTYWEANGQYPRRVRVG